MRPKRPVPTAIKMYYEDGPFEKFWSMDSVHRRCKPGAMTYKLEDGSIYVHEEDVVR